MRQLINILGAIILFLYFYHLTATDTQQAAPSNAKVLSYQIVEDTDKSKKVKLILTGSAYAQGNHCLVMNAKSDLSAYEHINTCSETDRSHGSGKCVIPCDSNETKLAYNILSPRNKYIYIFAANAANTAVAGTKNGNVFGFKIPLLVDPRVTISKSAGSKLKFSTKTCEKVTCPIKYKKVQYNEGAAGTNCDTASDIEVEFDLMIPYYEMQCEKYPSFYYHMPNKYMKKEIDIYKPQYYVTFKSAAEKTKYVVKFNNIITNEICRFGIRDAIASPKPSFAYVCGVATKECYAPCNNVELDLSASKVLVDISIQTRHHDIKAAEDNYDGFKETKFAIVETQDGLLKNKLNNGVTLNASFFKPASGTAFTACNIKHFPADKPRPAARAGLTTNCDDSSACAQGCEASLTLKGFPEGRAMMIEIASTGISKPDNLNEYLFLWTNPKASTEFDTIAPKVTETTAEIKALTADEDTDANQATCSYYISLTGKNIFEEAQCSDSYPCRGHCRESKTITNLIPGSTYDIKVVAHKEYAPKIYSGVKTNLATLTLKSTFLNKGFKVVGTLSSPDPDATCQFKLQRKDQEFKQVYICPSSTPILKRSVISNNLVEKINDSLENSSIYSKNLAKSIPFYEMKTARSGKSGTLTNVETSTTTVNFTPCTQPPLCNNIIVDEGYEADKEYKVLVDAMGRSLEVSILIPINPSLKTNGDVNKIIEVSIARQDKTFKVTVALPQDVDPNSLCKWELFNWEESSKPIIKKCVIIGQDCPAFPACNDISIPGIEINIKYRLRVILSTDDTIFGNEDIERGATSSKSTSSNTLIISIIVPVVLVIIGIGFYIGYMKNKN